MEGTGDRTGDLIVQARERCARLPEGDPLRALLEGLAERAAAVDLRRFERILETAGEGYLFLDRDFNIREVNQAYCRLVGRDRKDILGQPPFALATPEFRAFLDRNRERLLEQEYRTFEGSLRHADGRDIPVLIHSNALRGPDGELEGQVGFVSDMSEHRKALALAAEVQRGLLPSGPPGFPGLDVAGVSVPSQYAGGDYFDYLEGAFCPGGGLRVVVCDVTGHGLDAALLMSTARGFLRLRSTLAGPLAGVVADLNDHLARDTGDSGRFMTLFVAEFDPTGGMRWVRGGHDPALLHDPASGDFRELDGEGMALGVQAGASYEERSSGGLAPGQLLVLGTDGIWEARAPGGEMFGRERFRECIRREAGGSARQVLEGVFSALESFAGPNLDDDATLVVVKAL